jgi:predicted amidohydrolase
MSLFCHDREFSESACVLMLKGAELILVPNACEMEINRVTQLRVRSFENMCAIALANYAAPREDGHSVAFDGMAVVDDRWRDICLVQADGREDVFMAELDMRELRAYRAHEAWGNAYRKPRAYGELVSTRVEPPFQRPEARR